jgi:hypothetical protein
MNKEISSREISSIQDNINRVRKSILGEAIFFPPAECLIFSHPGQTRVYACTEFS